MPATAAIHTAAELTYNAPAESNLVMEVKMDSTPQSGSNDNEGLNPLLVMAVALIIVLLVLAIFALTGISEVTFDIEFAKALLDAGVVGVAGAYLAFLVEDHRSRIKTMEKERDAVAAQKQRTLEADKADRRYREDLLKVTLGRITASYNKAKRARRNMRALGRIRVSRSYQLRVPGYDDIMIDVIDAQLELETIISDVKTSCSTYPSARRILPRLRLMEDYLGQIIKEYEKERPKIEVADSGWPLAKLEEISDFIASSTVNPGFSRRYVRAHSSVRRSIRQDLLSLVKANELRGPVAGA